MSDITEITVQRLATTKPDPSTRKGAGFTYPRWSLETKPYWDGCLRGELRYQKCSDCNEVVFHPRALCPYCLSSNLRWEKSAGRGKIYSFALQHIPVHRDRPGKLPRAVGIIQLDEGYHMFSEIQFTGDGSELRVDLPVTVYFDRVASDLALPKFKLA
jgi:uncharacterized protein